MTAAIAACMAIAGQVNALPPLLLPAIHKIEGGEIGTVSTNANGTHDYGWMQINDVWIPFVSKATGLGPSTVREQLTNNPCFNIGVSAGILRHNLAEAHGDIWYAIGLYSSHTPKFNIIYQAKVALTAAELQQLSPASAGTKKKQHSK